MPRLRRRVVSTRRVSVRFVETQTRQQARQAMEEYLSAELERNGLRLTPEQIAARSFRIGPAEPVYDFGDTTLLGYRYDITALV